MSLSFDIDTAYDALDDSLVSDVLDLESYCSSLSPPVTSPEPIRHSTSCPRQRRHPRTRGHPRPTPAFALPPVTPSVAAPPVLSAPAVASSSAQPSVPGKPDKGKGHQQTTPPPSQPPPWLTLPQNSTSALCGCLSVSTSGSHVDGNQGSTNRVYGVWLKSSTPQKP